MKCLICGKDNGQEELESTYENNLCDDCLHEFYNINTEEEEKEEEVKPTNNVKLITRRGKNGMSNLWK
jgi:uncharacterized Zn ribbon protein